MTLSTHTLSSPQPQTRWRGLPAIIEVALVAMIFAGTLLAARVTELPLGGPLALIAATVTVTLLQRLRGEGWGELGMRMPKTLTSVALGGLAVVGICVTAFGVNGVLQPVLAATMGDGAVRALPDVSTVARYVTLMIVIWTTAAFAEEMVFRGFFMTRVADIFGRNAFGWTVALIVPAIFFGLAHSYQGLAGVIVTGTVGLIFGIWYLITKRNLLPLILAHGLVNSIGITMLFLIAQGVIPADAVSI